MAKRNLLAFLCLNLLGYIFQGFSQPVKIGLSLLFNGIHVPLHMNHSVPETQALVVFEESGGCWSLSKARPCQICPRATSRDEDNQGVLHFFLRRSCGSFHFLKTPDCAFSPLHGCHLDVSMKQKLAARSWTFQDGSTRSKGLCFSHTTVSSLPFSRIRMRQIPSVWFNPQYLILQESAGTHIAHTHFSNSQVTHRAKSLWVFFSL